MEPNRNIEDWLIAPGPLMLDWDAGLAALQQYYEELAMLRAGATYSELGISQRRAAAMPGIITAAGQRIDEPALLRNASATPVGSYAHLKLQGVMRSQDGLSTRGISALTQDIAYAASNPNVDGILLEINSGGGEVTAAQQLMAALDGIAKPVVAWAHVMASGAYYGALPSDEIIASTDGAMIGSIGTMITLPRNFSQFYKENYVDLYATRSSRKNEDFRAFLEGDLGPLRRGLDQTNDTFHAEVRKYRELSASNMDDTLSGAMFQAREARRRGLIDGIGGMDYAMKRLNAAIKRRKMK